MIMKTIFENGVIQKFSRLQLFNFQVLFQEVINSHCILLMSVALIWM